MLLLTVLLIFPDSKSRAFELVKLKRRQILYLKESGYTVSEIARTVGVSVSILATKSQILIIIHVVSKSMTMLNFNKQ